MPHAFSSSRSLQPRTISPLFQPSTNKAEFKFERSVIPTGTAGCTKVRFQIRRSCQERLYQYLRHSFQRPRHLLRSAVEIPSAIRTMTSIEIAVHALEVADRVVQYATKQNFHYRHARFGSAGHIVALLPLVDTRALRELHWNINTWTDEEVLMWKRSYMTSCNATQVVVSNSKSSLFGYRS